MLAGSPCTVALAREPAPAANAPELTAAQILRRADAVRFPQQGFEVNVDIQTTADGRMEDEHRYKVLSKGNENALVLTVAPAAERGQILLMKGSNLWVFLPRVSQPVRLSLAQRLVGQVANGDIARANFSGDYTPKVLGTERIGNDALYVLDLTAVKRTVTYQHVRYWVEQRNFRPYKADFYALSGRLLKTCRYEDFKPLGGKIRPTKLVMTDALNRGERSTMRYSDMKLRAIPDRVFSKDYLKRLE